MTRLDSIVRDYVDRYRNRAEAELKWFASQSTLEDAVTLAALAKSPSGRRQSHQRRIPHVVLIESRRLLLGSLHIICQASSFESLHSTIHNVLHPISGVGELTIYDTALRIAAKLGLEPNHIFLHAGTRIGAKRLGLNTRRPFINPDEFPRALRRLRPREIEDVLCIYKDVLVGHLDVKSIAVSCYPHECLTKRSKC